MSPWPYFLWMVSKMIPAASAIRESTTPNPGVAVVGITVGVSVNGGMAGDSVTDVVATVSELWYVEPLWNCGGDRCRNSGW